MRRLESPVLGYGAGLNLLMSIRQGIMMHDEDILEWSLEPIDGVRIPYEHFFSSTHAKNIWDYAMGEGGFCPIRHKALTEMHIKPHFKGLEKDPDLNNILFNRRSLR